MANSTSNYTVNYTLNVLNATQADKNITKFVESVNKLGNTIRIFDRLNKRVRQLNTLLNNKGWTLKINTTEAERKIDALQAKVNALNKSMGSAMNVGGAGKSASKSKSSSGKSGGTTSSNSRKSSSKQPTAPKPQPLPSGHYGSGKNAVYYGKTAPSWTPQGYQWVANDNLPIPSKFRNAYERVARRQGVAQSLVSNPKQSKAHRAYEKAQRRAASSNKATSSYRNAVSHYQSLVSQAQNNVPTYTQQLQAQRDQTQRLVEAKKTLKQQYGKVPSQKKADEIKAITKRIADSQAQEQAIQQQIAATQQVLPHYIARAQKADAGYQRSLKQARADHRAANRMKKALGRQRKWAMQNQEAAVPYTKGYSVVPVNGGGASKAAGKGAKAARSGQAKGRSASSSKGGGLGFGGGMVVGAAASMGISYGISHVASMVTDIFTQAVDYENTMTTVRNILGSNDTAADFKSRFANMERTVRDVGRRTKFTVTEVADASKFLAMAGLDVDQINSAIRPVANVALIGDTELGETADMLTNIMTGYNIRAGKMSHAADVMTKTFTRANVTLPEIAESFTYAGSLLSAGGVNFETANAAIGVLGDAGIKGSRAGTTMRTILSNIVMPRGKVKQEAWAALEEKGVRRFDESGNLRNINDIFTDLANQHLTVADMYKIFDKTAASGAVALAMHVDKWNQLVKENFMSDGMAEKLADAKKNTIQGLWAQLMSTISDNGIESFGGIQDGLKQLIVDVTRYFASSKGKDLITSLFKNAAGILDTLGDSMKRVLPLINLLSPWVTLLLKIRIQLLPLTIAMKAFQTTVGLFSTVGVAASKLIAFGRALLFVGSSQKKALVMNRWAQLKRMFSLANPAVNRYYDSMVGTPVNPNSTDKDGRPLMRSPYSYEEKRRMVGKRQNRRQNWLQRRHKILSTTKNWRGSVGGTAAIFASGAVGSIGGGLAGAAIGDKLGGESGAMLGGIVGTVAGGAAMSWLASAAPALLTNPVGWGILAVAAIGAVCYAVHSINQDIKKANEASEKWAKSMQHFGIGSIDYLKSTGIQDAAIRITSAGDKDVVDITRNRLININAQLALGREAWEKWWIARQGPKENESPLDFKPGETLFASEGEQLIHDATSGTNNYNSVWKPRWDAMRKQTGDNRWRYTSKGCKTTFYTPGGHVTIDTGTYSKKQSLYLAELYQASLTGTDPNKPGYNPFYASGTEQLITAFHSLQNASDWANTASTIIDNTLPQANPAYGKIASGGEARPLWENMHSYGAIPIVNSTNKTRLSDYAGMFNPALAIRSRYENGQAMAMSDLMEYFRLTTNHEIFYQNKYGEFLSPQWLQNVSNYMYDSKGRVIPANVAKVQEVWSQMNTMFDLASPQFKQFLAPAMDYSKWQSMFPQGTDITEGGFHPGRPGQYGYDAQGRRYIYQSAPSPFAGLDMYGWYATDDNGKAMGMPLYDSNIKFETAPSHIPRLGYRPAGSQPQPQAPQPKSPSPAQSKPQQTAQNTQSAPAQVPVPKLSSEQIAQNQAAFWNQYGIETVPLGSSGLVAFNDGSNWKTGNPFRDTMRSGGSVQNLMAQLGMKPFFVPGPNGVPVGNPDAFAFKNGQQQLALNQTNNSHFDALVKIGSITINEAEHTTPELFAGMVQGAAEKYAGQFSGGSTGSGSNSASSPSPFPILSGGFHSLI